MRRLFLTAMFVAAFGCGKGDAIIQGKITYKNQPVTTGQIHFIGEKGESRSSLITQDGSYEIQKAPLGKCNVAIVAEQVKNPPTTGDPTKLKTAVPKPIVVSLVPRKYNKAETSTLSFEIKGGRQTINLDLKD